MLASLLFAAYAIVALAAGVLVVAARSSRMAVEALFVALLAGCCAYVQVMATAVAAAQLVLLAGAAIAALRVAVRADEAPPGPRAWRRLVVLVPVAAVALVLVSTWARQYVWTGRELLPGTRLGAAAKIGQVWAELYAPTLGLAMMALLVAAIAGLAGREHR